MRAIEALIAEAGLAGVVRVEPVPSVSASVGLLPELRRLDAAVYVNSMIELAPFHSDVVEALGAGVPTVASRMGVLSELIENERTGLLTVAGDHAALAAAIVRVLGEPGLAETLSSNARLEFATRFALERYVVQALAAYQHCADFELAEGRDSGEVEKQAA